MLEICCQTSVYAVVSTHDASIFRAASKR